MALFIDGNSTDLFQAQTDFVTEIVTDGTDTDERRGLYALFLPMLLVTSIIITNGLSLAAFAVEKRLRGYNNYFIINLTISDFLFGFVLIIMSLHTYFGRFPLPSNNWCKVFYGVFSSIQFVSNLVIVIICLDRHRATYDPIGHFTSRSKRKALYVNIGVWVASVLFWFAFSTIPDFLLRFNNSPACFAWHYVNPIAQIVPVFIRFIIPFTVISFLYVRIFIKIRETTGSKHIDKEFDGDSKQSGHSESEDDGDMKKQRPQTIAGSGVQKGAKRESVSEVRSATKTLLFIVIVFFISWCPSSNISNTVTQKWKIEG
eukprot:XP_001186388.1 PREDICTED: 5-hydroxytryptamine receptor 2A-like [Strongylocentrotus purpuratus]